jgi:hypothetical protein
MMKTSRLAKMLQENVGKRVWVKDASGDTAVLLVGHVDGEGCTCRVFENSDYDPNLPYWWDFEEIAEAHAESADTSDTRSDE